MKIEKEKYMNACLSILQGLLASGKYNEIDFTKKSTSWEVCPVVDALSITDEFFELSDACQSDDNFFEMADLK